MRYSYAELLERINRLSIDPSEPERAVYFYWHYQDIIKEYPSPQREQLEAALQAKRYIVRDIINPPCSAINDFYALEKDSGRRIVLGSSFGYSICELAKEEHMTLYEYWTKNYPDDYYYIELSQAYTHAYALSPLERQYQFTFGRKTKKYLQQKGIPLESVSEISTSQQNRLEVEIEKMQEKIENIEKLVKEKQPVPQSYVAAVIKPLIEKFKAEQEQKINELKQLITSYKKSQKPSYAPHPKPRKSMKIAKSIKTLYDRYVGINANAANLRAFNRLLNLLKSYYPQAAERDLGALLDQIDWGLVRDQIVAKKSVLEGVEEALTDLLHKLPPERMELPSLHLIERKEKEVSEYNILIKYLTNNLSDLLDMYHRAEQEHDTELARKYRNVLELDFNILTAQDLEKATKDPYEWIVDHRSLWGG